MRKIIISLALAVSGIAFAQTPQSVRATFDKGDWQAAAAAALEIGGSNGFALAAEFTTAGAGITQRSDDQVALYNKAQEYARKAIKLDNENADAYFELARAIGRLAQSRDPLSQLNMAKEMKKALDKTIALDDKMAAPYAALSIWNATLDSGGLKGAIAKSTTGADNRQSVALFEKAISLQPDLITHRVEFGNVYLLLGDKASAKAQFEKAITMKANTFWTKRDLAYAQDQIAKLK